MRQIVFEPYIPLSLWVLLAVAATSALTRYLLRLRGTLQAARWRAVAVLMAVSILLPLLMLLNPTWLEQVPPPPGKPHLTVLVDGSTSMGAPADESGRSRWELAVETAAHTVEQLQQQYEIEVRTFTNQTQLCSINELADRSADGQHTNLAQAISDVLETTSPQGQAILLLSDGIHNASGGTAAVRRAVAAADAVAIGDQRKGKQSQGCPRQTQGTPAEGSRDPRGAASG